MPQSAHIHLKVLLPFAVFAEKSDVSRIVAETRTGSFGILAHRLDCVAALVPGILIYETTAEGEVYVMDAHRGALLLALPPAGGAASPRWLGQVGSEHYALVDAQGLALGPGGTLGAAVHDGQRAWLLDREKVLINWLGKPGEHPVDWGYPTALLLAGERLTVAVSVDQPDPGSLLALPFDQGLTGVGGEEPDRVSKVTSAPGRLGQGVRVVPGGVLRYPAQGNIDLAQGALEVWVQPAWPGSPRKERVLVDICGFQPSGLEPSGLEPSGLRPGSLEPGTYRLRLGLYEDAVYVLVTNHDDREAVIWAEAWQWQPGEWHHLAVTWQEYRLSLYIDGRWQGDALMPRPIIGAGTDAVAHIAVGATITGALNADAILDELRISAYPRMGNSDQGRLLLAQRNPARIDVLDLMGNRVSRYQPPLASPGALIWPGDMAWWGDGQLWVADRVHRRLDLLAFDGDALAYHRSLALELGQEPRGLDAYNGLLAVGHGSRVTLADPGRGDAIWGTLDVAGSGLVSALAFGPDGTLAVASLSPPQVILVPGAAHVHRFSLPYVGR